MPETTPVAAFWPHPRTMPTTPTPVAAAPKPAKTTKPKAAKGAGKRTPVAELEISRDPLPTERLAVGEFKYDAKFEAMSLGDCLKCLPSEVPRIANAMRSWIKRDDRKGVGVVSAKNYIDPRTGEPTGTGRVWLVKKDEK